MVSSDVSATAGEQTNGAKSPRMRRRTVRAYVVPTDALVLLLPYVTSARDVMACACVSRAWAMAVAEVRTIDLRLGFFVH